MRKKLRRALCYERAGLQVPDGIPLLRKREKLDDCEPIETTEHTIKKLKATIKESARTLSSDHVNGSTKAVDDGYCYEGKSKAIDSVLSVKCISSHLQPVIHGGDDNLKQLGFPKENMKENKQSTKLFTENDKEERHCSKAGDACTEKYNSRNAMDSDGKTKKKFVEHVMRSEEVRKSREKLPIIMMEQEIMEAINDNPVTIVCGETGCGKTTQVPQFLYEAGFSSSEYVERAGIIGITQPRRVAVLATAKRLSYEMNLALGQEVGFQVRHDRKLGHKTRIKFMTDGILLRELQSDFLLRRYSVIVLDEAHERSLNTDILIGLLSRVVPLRQEMYEEQNRAGRASVYPLKIVIMSATLLVDEFVGNRTLFASPPPIIEVPARQYPVTVHFSAKTELIDYVGKAYKKVCAIHKKLPPGGVLVFLTGQAEVHQLCKKLSKAYPQPESRNNEHQIKDENSELNSISEMADGFVGEDELQEEPEFGEIMEADGSPSGTDSESDLEFSETESEKSESMQDLKWSEGDCIHLESIKDAFDALLGTKKRVDSENPTAVKQDSKNEIGPVYVLPLYALLPAASQLKVFGAVPEGSRLVVVATNVAETSITIPGIRYVVDCGRAKEKVFECSSGITRYEINWISKASASQRAGRAGRTGPGHCYRLYSSAIFNDNFPDFPRPEIYRAPIEGTILLLKSMNIVKVTRFPFISEPAKSDLIEAENCLHALSALDSNTGCLTPLGHAIALYPISPRHSRMLLTAMQIGHHYNVKDNPRLLAYAAATVAALSLDNPFMIDIASEQDQDSKCEGGASQNMHSTGTDVEPVQGKADLEFSGGKVNASLGIKSMTERKELTQAKKTHNQSYRHPLSDALSIVKALRAYELSDDPEELCSNKKMHSRILYEMSKLRKQLIQVYLVYSNEKETSGVSFCQGFTVADVEVAWKKDGVHCDLCIKHETVLRQAICAGWADRIARKVNMIEMAKDSSAGKHKGRPYHICATDEKVYIHPSSSLRKHAPEYVVFNELVRTSRPYMKLLTSIDVNWLVTHASPLCTFSKPLSDPPPWYDSIADDIYCWVSPTFGPHLWQLPLHQCPLKSKKHRVAVFACAFLQGKVLPSMKMLNQYLAADPSTLVVSSGSVQKRVIQLLHALETMSIDSRSKLRSIWEVQTDYLFQEIVAWFQKSYRLHLESIWAVLKQEAQLDGKTLFAKEKRKKRK
ncbi:hypothetical protein KP509_09G059400 [Ceratopteris richardii]|nr:hypothetical protein KP509_09G059400 [Ceratopteris richardii]